MADLYDISGSLLSEEVLAKLVLNDFIEPEEVTEMLDEMLLILERAMARHRRPPAALTAVQRELEHVLAIFARPQDHA
jgi:hypothetical protein